MPDANPTTSRRDNAQEKARKQAYYQANPGAHKKKRPPDEAATWKSIAQGKGLLRGQPGRHS